MFRIRDQMKLYHDGSLLYDTGCVGGGVTRMVPYSGLARFVTVDVLPNCSGNTSGTAWNYTLSCPSQ